MDFDKAEVGQKFEHAKNRNSFLQNADRLINDENNNFQCTDHLNEKVRML